MRFGSSTRVVVVSMHNSPGAQSTSNEISEACIPNLVTYVFKHLRGAFRGDRLAVA